MSFLKVESNPDVVRKAMNERLHRVAANVIRKYGNEMTNELIRELAAEASRLSIELQSEMKVQTLGQDISIHVRIG